MFEKKSPVDGVPVIPGGSWLTGHLSLMKEPDFQVALHKWSVEHADVNGRTTFWLGPTTPALSVTDPSDIQQLLKATSHRELFPLMGKHMETFFGRYNIASLTGREWKEKRSIIVKALHGHRLLENNQRAFQKATEALVSKWLHEIADEEQRKGSAAVQVEDIQRVLQMLTMDAFGLAALHTDFGCCKHMQPSSIAQDLEFLAQEMMRRLIESPLDPSSYFYSLPTAANRSFCDANERIASFIANLVKERRQVLSKEGDEDSVPQDLLTYLIQATSEGDDFSEEMMANVIKSLLFAGYETTSTSLTFVLYLLSLHPTAQDSCHTEITAIEELTPECSTSKTEYNYLNAVITETLRLYPPAISTTRTLDRDFTLQTQESSDEKDSLFISKGMYLYFPIWVIQRNPKNFPEPTSFIPERWVFQDTGGAWKRRHESLKEDCNQHLSADSISSIATGNPNAFVAFSSGGRSCAGEKFARQEMTTILSMLLRSFKIELVSKDYELSVHRKGFVISPKEPIALTMIRRS